MEFALGDLKLTTLLTAGTAAVFRAIAKLALFFAAPEAFPHGATATTNE